jgi:hypothetical protein
MRSMDDSFVLLAGSASVLRQGPDSAIQPPQQQQAQQQAGPGRQGTPLQALDDRFAQLARIFELASGETAVWPPNLHTSVCYAHA